MDSQEQNPYPEQSLPASVNLRQETDEKNKLKQNLNKLNEPFLPIKPHRFNQSLIKKKETKTLTSKNEGNEENLKPN